MVNGPEVLSKYVGQSEENVRNLFKEAKEEMAAKGDESELHVIIFDELDAICKQRGATIQNPKPKILNSSPSASREVRLSWDMCFGRYKTFPRVPILKNFSSYSCVCFCRNVEGRHWGGRQCGEPATILH